MDVQRQGKEGSKETWERSWTGVGLIQTRDYLTSRSEDSTAQLLWTISCSGWGGGTLLDSEMMGSCVFPQRSSLNLHQAYACVHMPRCNTWRSKDNLWSWFSPLSFTRILGIKAQAAEFEQQAPLPAESPPSQHLVFNTGLPFAWISHRLG